MVKSSEKNNQPPVRVVTPLSPAQTEKAYLERSEAELAGYGAYFEGSPFASLLCIKGKPGEAELAGGRPLSGPDGASLKKSLERLGYFEKDLGLCLLSPSGVPVLDPANLRYLVESVDPQVIVALDADSLEAIVAAYEGRPEAGPSKPCFVQGRKLVAVDGFEELLSSDEGKHVAWRQLKMAVRPGEPY